MRFLIEKGFLALFVFVFVCDESRGSVGFVFDDPNTVLGMSGGAWGKIGGKRVDSVWYWKGTNTLGQTLEIRHRQATSGTTDEAFFELLSGVDEELSGLSIDVHHRISDQLLEFAAVGKDGEFLYVVYRTPRGAFLWRFSGLRPEAQKTLGEKVRFYAGSEQYSLALKRGNVCMGAWAESIHTYARMLARRQDTEAETVYRELLRRNASNYPAHLEFARLATDETLREESLRIVMREAEDETLLKEASLLLGLNVPDVDDYPILSEKDIGFHVVLIPLPPCNFWMLEEVAEAYESITTIPVVIRRLPEPWKFSSATRSVYRGELEKLAFKLLPDEPSVKMWPRLRLQKALMKAAKEKDPAAVPYLEVLFKQIEEGGFQWKVSPLVAELDRQVRAVLPVDRYTMVVGVTGNDIYSDKTRYVFSQYGGGRAPLSVLSYSRMTAYKGETQSRKRLVERCAKELVPATLKKLCIPRSTDPACPYSYANGVRRLDEKTYDLSLRVMDEIVRIGNEVEAK